MGGSRDFWERLYSSTVENGRLAISVIFCRLMLFLLVGVGCERGDWSHLAPKQDTSLIEEAWDILQKPDDPLKVSIGYHLYMG